MQARLPLITWRAICDMDGVIYVTYVTWMAESPHWMIYQEGDVIECERGKMVYHNSGRVDSEEWSSASPTVNTVPHLIERILGWINNMRMMSEIMRMII